MTTTELPCEARLQQYEEKIEELAEKLEDYVTDKYCKLQQVFSGRN
jgi:hypothetical protein